MRIIRPVTIDDAALISSSVSETISAYNAGTTYALGNQVRSDTTHRVYESAQAGNTGHALTDTAWWTDIGPTNRWAMFDNGVATQTTGATGFNVTIAPAGRIDSLALLNVDAATVRVVVNDGVSDVYDVTYSMAADSGVIDWYAYFYEPIRRKTDLIITDIQLISSPHITVTFAASGDPCSCGVLITGQSKIIGSTQYGAGLGIIDYSRKTVDDFGNYVIIERAFSRKGTFRVMVDAGLVDEAYYILSGYRATPILYIGTDDYTSAAIFGFFRDFNVEIAYPLHSLCTLELEGLT